MFSQHFLIQSNFDHGFLSKLFSKSIQLEVKTNHSNIKILVILLNSQKVPRSRLVVCGLPKYNFNSGTKNS